jgi:hypothetical protein
MYVGVGGGWHKFREESPSLNDVVSDQGSVSYHLLGGAEYPVAPWVSLAGDIQWTAVPGVIGDNGVSAVFDESNLGGTTFRFKVIVGR